MRLIDADAFLESEIERCGTVPYIGLCLTNNESFKVVLDEQPTVDAETVRYGEWIPQDETYTKFMCSECNSKNYKGHEKYCPNCGAKMEVE